MADQKAPLLGRNAVNRGSSRTNEDRYGTSGAGPASDDHVPAPSAADAYETPSDDGSPSRERGYHRRRRRPGRGSCGSTCEPFTLREAVLFTWALLASATAVIVLAFVLREGQMRISSLVAEQGYSREESFLSPLFSTHSRTGQPRTRPLSRKRPKRNLIFMVSDGMGPTSLSLTRSFSQLISSAPFNNTLSLDASFHGTSRTRSSWSLVTDSAAGATAFGCGRKTYNGAIGMTDKFEPCATVMEAAKRLGYYTGLVVTTDVSDATPASFIAHAYYRAMMDDIALQEVGNGTLGRVADVLMGGGRCHFLPNTTTGSCRADDIDVLALARSAEFGWNYVDDRAGFDALDGGKNVSLPLLGLFADNDLPFHIDRREGSKNAKTYPSLGEMAATAIKALHDAAAADDDSPGVFLMIEGSRIDHAGHENDPAAQVWEVLEYDGVWAQMKAWLDASGEEGALVSTSDHETGGLATAWQSPTDMLPIYNWFPSSLAKANASAEHLSMLLQQHLADTQSSPLLPPSTGATDVLRDWINTRLVIGGLGIADARPEELDALAANPERAARLLAAMISARAHVGWSTRGHSAVDVNVYAHFAFPAEEEAKAELLKGGNMENTDIGRWMARWLRVDDGLLHDITKQLNDSMATDSREGWSQERVQHLAEEHVKAHWG